MNKNTIKDIVMISACALLLINFFNTYEIKKELVALTNETRSLQHNLSSSISSEVRAGYANIENMLNKGASIFSSTSIEMKLQGKKSR